MAANLLFGFVKHFIRLGPPPEIGETLGADRIDKAQETKTDKP